MELRAGIEKINTSKAAYVSVDSMFFGQEQNDSLCRFKSNVKIEGGRVNYAQFMRYHDPIRVFFKYKFSKWDERGIHRRERQKFNHETLPVCDTTGISDVKTISLVDVASALFIFGVGTFISFSCLTAEIITHSKKCPKVMSQFDSICEQSRVNS
ncbi:unnamed protein product [Allacma fusca]|uniref:Uncharacterized protein n=1 Tax=Allacma fusca TaxID=39272 RepID=A0A8J2KVU3_9HEXA|nr:unnamed protein product [Allacma fusca]